MRNLIKNTTKYSLAVLAFVVLSAGPVFADAVVNQRCTTTKGTYGSKSTCIVEGEKTGFISNEVVAASAAIFAIGATGLVANNVLKSKLENI